MTEAFIHLGDITILREFAKRFPEAWKQLLSLGYYPRDFDIKNDDGSDYCQFCENDGYGNTECVECFEHIFRR